MKTQNPHDGGPISSSIHSQIPVGTDTFQTQTLTAVGGLSIRDWFAGMALQGLLASGHFTEPADEDEQAWMTTHDDPYDDETGEEIHKGRRRFDFPSAAWTCADRMLSTREGSKP